MAQDMSGGRQPEVPRTGYRPLAPEEAMHRLNVIMAHLWMVRRFLKHAEELEQAPHLHEVHRVIFDYVRAVEPSWQRRDAREYLRRARGKWPKLQRVAELLSQEYRQVSDHTNFEMAALSLSGCVQQIAEILNAVSTTPSGSISPAPGAGPESLAHPAKADPCDHSDTKEHLMQQMLGADRPPTGFAAEEDS
ncbi:hypothetical protein HRbin36_02426 [bacterium HR36]|nr:hypothetical protein HRbin36_02426 [bacterium HR36]